MSEQPLVSVIVPTFNEPPGRLALSFESLIAQTYANFEVLVVDESTDPALAEACDTLCRRDARFRRLRPPRRLGLAGSLNLGLSEARGPYIARFDGDDLCHPERLEAQVRFLDAHLDVDLLGSAMEIIDSDGAVHALRRYPLTHDAIALRMQFTNAFAHPTMMMRQSVLGRHGGYDASFDCAEDLELWLRLLGLGARFANLSEPLVRYRQVSSDRRAQNWSQNLRARTRHLSPKLLPARLAGLAVVALWALTPPPLRRAIYRLSILTRPRETPPPGCGAGLPPA